MPSFVNFTLRVQTQLLGIKMKPLIKQLMPSVESSVYEGNEVEQIVLFLQLLRLVKIEGHFSSRREDVGKIDYR